ncbi:sigma-70 family RNA polymerase sigma factor [Echinicola strongylocentroti]|uniref:Sigma-70 family RNA polymerase sigma factor n=1 Tax=Echinicola strongylocentroti TaxID=1795355 RepID=A0A2Z4IPX6_9BACT|nr:sigma-70 family RNA polymerase sigma factor [Echinicola strongylocentroti]AWW32887.1 sigma-70 family RNA polymerase sigma factor [Echinicola strongylocentroti]
MSTQKLSEHDCVKWSESSREDDSNKYGHMTDAELWEIFRSGDESAFVHIYNMYFEELCHYGVQYVQLPIVEDCVQDLFVDLRRKRGKLPAIKKTIRLFLFQALKHRIFNVLKKNSPEYRSEMTGCKFGVTVSHESLLIMNQQQKETLQKLEKALSSLSEKHREVIYHYFYKGIGYEELKEIMGYDHVKSARNMVYKIVTVLKRVITLTSTAMIIFLS